jgi:hypothetical protein
MVLGKLDMHMKTKIRSLYTPWIKTNWKSIKDLNVRHDTLKVLEENWGKDSRYMHRKQLSK